MRACPRRPTARTTPKHGECLLELLLVHTHSFFDCHDYAEFASHSNEAFL